MIRQTQKGMNDVTQTKYQTWGALLLILLAIIRLLNIGQLNAMMDNTFFLLLFLAAVLFFIPLHKIKIFKAGGVEIELFENKIRGAIQGLEKEKIDNEKLFHKIINYAGEIAFIQGSRVLWIDDTPNAILGERRIFRALGIEIHTANNRESALGIISRDTDFDLIISDIQWLKEPGNPNSDVFYGGIELIRELRTHFRGQPIGEIKTIFYTSFTHKQIEIINKQTGFLSLSNIALCYTIEELIRVVIDSLTKSRTNPITVSSSKNTFYPKI